MEQQDSKIHFRLPYHLPNSKEVSVPMEWMLLLGFLMGWAVGWIQGSAIPKARVEQLEMDLALAKAHLEQMETELVWARAKVHSLESDLERVNLKASEKATGIVQELVKEKVQEPMSESAKAQALAKGWGWVMGLEQDHLPKQ